MATAHIESEIDDISSLVIMPGDPLRAKYIADNFLTNVKIINKVRNMIGYTGYYKDKKITVFPSGMGIPSMGIYAYELFKFYDVKKIIRIGTCGTLSKDVGLRDIILADSAYSLSFFPKLFAKEYKSECLSSLDMNKKIQDTAKSMNINLKNGEIITSDVWDPYVDPDKFISNYPKRNFLACEMEAFVLFYLAEKFKKDATTLLTVVDSKYDKRSLSSAEREKSLNDMILLALNSIIVD